MAADDKAVWAAKSLEMIEGGGISLGASIRLQENASKQGTPEHLFTSNLSPNEFLLTRHCGYEPLGQVMGTAVYHVGWQWMPGQTWGDYNPLTGLPASREMEVLTGAYIHARQLTFGRLRQEAALLKADGVVGVRFERIGFDMAGTFEFKAVGTAVRKIGAPPTSGEAFLSNLSGQDHWALRQAGLDPAGFVFGTCCWYQVSSWQNQMANWGSWSNAELPDFTQGIYSARELALERMEYEARQVGARGVVGVAIDPEIELIEAGGNNSRRDLLAKFTIFGTAVRWEPGRKPDASIALNLPLSDP